MHEKTNDFRDLSSPETTLTHSGRHPELHTGFVNTPVFRGSTVLFQTLDELEDYTRPYRYGRNDNPTMQGVNAVVTELEGAAGTVLASSGLAAITTALLSVLSQGDEVLVTDSAYEPTRNFCRETLARFGITTRFYDPRVGAGIAELFSDRTRMIVAESPGSLTFEVQDLPAIAAAAHARDIAVMVDNSWATPLYYRPFALGADLVVHSGTKMFIGHSDAMFGTISANARYWPQLARSHRLQGAGASPDDAYLAARGLRTLAIRMKEHSSRALSLASWLEQQPGVARVLHPALPSHPDHAVFQRDFTGSGSLFAMALPARDRAAVAAMVDGFRLFGMGYSWGGYESLCLPIDPARARSVTAWGPELKYFRIHVGFEDLADLQADMSAALARYAAA